MKQLISVLSILGIYVLSNVFGNTLNNFQKVPSTKGTVKRFNKSNQQELLNPSRRLTHASDPVLISRHTWSTGFAGGDTGFLSSDQGGSEHKSVMNQNSGIIYSIGGLNEHGLFNSVWKFDTKDFNWALLDTTASAVQIPALAGHAALLTKDSLIYSVGGVKNDGSVLSNVYILNTTSGSWTEIIDVVGDPFNGLQYISGVILRESGVIYIFGGMDASNVLHTSSLLTFNTNTNTWNEIAVSGTDATTALSRIGHTAIIDEVDEVVYIYGGFFFSSTTSRYLDDVMVYDIKANTWNTLTISGSTVPQARAYHSAVWDTHAKVMYIIGGKQSQSAFKEIFVLNPFLRTWTQITLVNEDSVQYLRSSHQSVFDTNAREIYTIGGSGLDQNGAYEPLKDVCILSNADYAQVTDWTPLYQQDSSSSLFLGRSEHSFTYRKSTGTAYMIGGLLESGACSDEVWLFDPVTNKWTQKITTNVVFPGRCGHTASFANNVYIDVLLYVIGGYNSIGVVSNDVWRLDTDEFRFRWKLIPIYSATSMSARKGHSAVTDTYTDPLNSLIYVIGGTDAKGHVLNDVWAYHGNTWTSISTSGSTFPARTGHSAVIDLTHGTDINIYVMGGNDGTVSLSDVWILNLLTFSWSKITPTSSSIITPRQSFSSVFNPQAGVVYSFGGRTESSSVLYNDVWKLDLVTLEWTDLSSPSLLENNCVTSRYGHASIFLDSTNVMYTVGGNGGSSVVKPHLSDTWGLSDRYLVDNSNGGDELEWLELSTTLDTAPVLQSSAAVINTVTNSIYFIGGYNAVTLGYYDKVWQLKTDTTNALSSVTLIGTAFTARRDHTAVIDTAATSGGRVYIIGGSPTSTTYISQIFTIDLTDGTGAVVTPTVTGGIFSARSKHTANLLANGGDIYIIGGETGASVVVNEVWIFTTSNSGLSNLTTTGATLPVRAGHTSVYDAVNNAVYVIGGADGSGNALGDIYKLSVSTSTWTAVTAAGSSVTFTARQHHTAAYDSVNQLIYVIGGKSSTGETLSDVWTFDVNALIWKQLAVPGSCFTARQMHTTVMDTYNGILYTTGGIDSDVSSNIIYHSDTWQLFTQSHAKWLALQPVYFISPLTARQYHSSVLDATNDVIYIMGGEMTEKIYEDIWSYSIKTSYLRQFPLVVRASEGHVSVIDNTIRVIYRIGGYNSYVSTYVSEVLAFNIESATSNTISTTGASFTSRQGHAGVIKTASNSIYIFGGLVSGSGMANDVWKLVYTYNVDTMVSTGVWSNLTFTGSYIARYQHTAVLHEGTGKVYLIGGYSVGSAVLNDVQVYDISAGSFTTLTPTGDAFTARAAHTSLIDHYSGFIYVVGGYDSSNTPLSDAWVLDIANSVWTQLYTHDAYTARAGHASVMDITSGTIYNSGGFTVSDGATIYNSDMWTLSGLAVNAPTTSPTSFPTVRPTRTPTFAPTSAPTDVPTVMPSMMPTYKPTSTPTYVPSKLPSVTPTYKPSQVPTYTPTRLPTIAPSRPTVSPTLARPVTKIEMTQYINRDSIYPEDLVQSSNGQTAFINTIVEVLNDNDVESVTLRNATLEQRNEGYLNGSTSVAIFANSMNRFNVHNFEKNAKSIKINDVKNGMAKSNNNMNLEGLVEVVIMRYFILVRTPAVGTAQAEYDALIASLKATIADGSFNTKLEANAAIYNMTDFNFLSFYSLLTSSFSTPITPPTYTPTQAPNNKKPSSSSSSLSTGAIVGIAVAMAILCLCLIGLCFYRFWYPRKKREVMAPQSFYLEEGEEEQSSFKRSPKRGGLRGSIAFLRGSIIGGSNSPKKPSSTRSIGKSNNRNSVNAGERDQFGVRASILVDPNGNSTKPAAVNNASNNASLSATSPLHSREQQDVDSALRLSTVSPQISPRENDGLVDSKFSPRAAAEEKA